MSTAKPSMVVVVVVVRGRGAVVFSPPDVEKDDENRCIEEGEDIFQRVFEVGVQIHRGEEGERRFGL